jgi:hypothetical protein
MRVLPILFNIEMVKAILNGKKTCTRRIVKGYIPTDAEFGYTAFTPKDAISCRGTFETDHQEYGEKFFKLPYQPGDILYVRETWSEIKNADGSHKKYVYKASDQYPFGESRYIIKFNWKPSIHMPKEAARIWLKVTNVRVERLQNITEAEAILEGATNNIAFIHSPDNEYDHIHTAREHFIDIWNSTIKKGGIDKYGWDANPFVWVIEFEWCDKPGKE